MTGKKIYTINIHNLFSRQELSEEAKKHRNSNTRKDALVFFSIYFFVAILFTRQAKTFRA